MVKEQLTLRFGWADTFSFANFYVGENQALVECLNQAGHGEGEQFVYLWSTVGCGKSHLLQAACETAASLDRKVAYLPLEELKIMGPEVLDGLGQMDLLCLDDIEQVSGDIAWETALFNLYNTMRGNGGVILVSANQAPAGLAIQLEDLRSRLGWGPVFRVVPLDDHDKIEALRLRAHARGFDLPVEVAEFLMRRSARDTVSLFELLDRLDQASLAQQRKLTIPFVRTLL